MTDPKPRAAASIDVVSRGEANILISSMDDTFTDVRGRILREGPQCYRVETADGAVVTRVQQYRRAARPLARYHEILPAHTLQVRVTHAAGSHLAA
jgi:hypothetical protein